MKARDHLVVACLGAGAALLIGWATRPDASAPPSPAPATRDPVAPPPAERVSGTALAPMPRQLVRQRDLLASDPGYDAIQLGVEEELTPKEIFESEPRDEPFATNQERLLRQTFADVSDRLGVASSIREVSLECRTLSCEATLVLDREQSDHVYDVLNGMPFAPVVEVSPPPDDGDPETRSMKLALLFKPGHRDARAFQKWQANVLWPRIERVAKRTR